MTSSATGGYTRPTSSEPLPRGLSLNQFLQTVIVGVSGLDGQLVRPQWQISPPKTPDITVDWISFGNAISIPDANGYLGVDEDGASIYQRHEGLQVQLSISGPNAMEIAGIIRDGFQIPQNLEGLRAANMGFVETTQAMHVPDLVNERFRNRVEMNIILRREVQRVYPVLTLVSATGRVHTVVGDEEYLMDWDTENRRT